MKFGGKVTKITKDSAMFTPERGLNSALVRYVADTVQLKKFKEANPALMNTLHELQLRVDGAKDQLRAEAKRLVDSEVYEAGKWALDKQGDTHVEADVSYPRSVDADKLRALVPESARWEGVFGVSLKAFNKAVKAGLIGDDVAGRVLDTSTNPRVTIRIEHKGDD